MAVSLNLPLFLVYLRLCPRVCVSGVSSCVLLLGVFHCDGLVSAELKATLDAGIAVLENVPERELDW